MPYIKQENRPKFDKVIDCLNEDYIKPLEITYILFELCKRYITPSYNNYKNFCGELRQCATEIERRTGALQLNVSHILPMLNEYDPISERMDLCERKINFMIKSDIKVNGDLNYILYGYCNHHITTFYHNKAQFSMFSKELREAACLIEVEILAPYEDKKIEENGDV